MEKEWIGSGEGVEKEWRGSGEGVERAVFLLVRDGTAGSKYRIGDVTATSPPRAHQSEAEIVSAHLANRNTGCSPNKTFNLQGATEA